jgi:hypothetical protein
MTNTRSKSSNWSMALIGLITKLLSNKQLVVRVVVAFRRDLLGRCQQTCDLYHRTGDWRLAINNVSSCQRLIAARSQLLDTGESSTHIFIYPLAKRRTLTQESKAHWHLTPGEVCHSIHPAKAADPPYHKRSPAKDSLQVRLPLHPT